MSKSSIVSLLVAVFCAVADAESPVSLPKDVPPVIGTAAAIASSAPRADSDRWSIELVVPKVAWEVVGEERPKLEWPEFKVTVEEAVLTLQMGYHPATQLSENAQNRVLDLKGRRLGRDEALKRLAAKTPVLVSVSGRMPDPFYLQCTKPDTLIVVLGIPSYPAPELLPCPTIAKKTSFKAWELYIWEQDGTIFYCLMVGTNRIKTDDEIAGSAVKGFEAIKSKLDQLQEGESVFVHGRRLAARPPSASAKAVTEYCEKIGLRAR